MAGDIKAAARALMHEHGTAGLTLRGIARELGVTAPAIYHYFPCLDDLITALIVDAYADEAAAILEAVAAAAAAGPVQQVLAGLFAYRAWALAHPIEFQLIFGNPIPGYTARQDTIPPLTRPPFAELGGIVSTLYTTGQLRVPEAYADIPPTIAAQFDAWRAAGLHALPDVVVYVMAVAWSRIHGMVSLELYGHLKPTLGDPDALYRHEILAFLAQLGLAP